MLVVYRWVYLKETFFLGPPFFIGPFEGLSFEKLFLPEEGLPAWLLCPLWPLPLMGARSLDFFPGRPSFPPFFPGRPSFPAFKSSFTSSYDTNKQFIQG